jgi:hypothetical protein
MNQSALARSEWSKLIHPVEEAIMSGRPYARNPRAPYAGPRDLEAVLPHAFRLETHEAIRRWEVALKAAEGG